MSEYMRTAKALYARFQAFADHWWYDAATIVTSLLLLFVWADNPWYVAVLLWIVIAASAGNLIARGYRHRLRRKIRGRE